MRDGAIMAGLGKLQAEMSHDITVLMDVIAVLEMRIRATEQALYRNPWARFLLLFQPKKFHALVDQIHNEALAGYHQVQKQRREVQVTKQAVQLIKPTLEIVKH